jgi:hypothetical protein
VKVFAMMKMPTNSEIPAKTSIAVCMPLMLFLIVSDWSAASFLPVTAFDPAGRISCAWSFSSLCEVPGAAFSVIWSYCPISANSRCAVGVLKSTRVPPAATLPSSVSKTPTMRCLSTGPSTDMRAVSPTSNPTRFAVAASIATSWERCGARPSFIG